MAKISKPETNAFKVAFSYPGSHDSYVELIDSILVNALGRDRVFWYKAPEYKSLLNSQNLIQTLTQVYSQAELTVVIITPDYLNSDFCGWEYQQVLKHIFSGNSERVFLLKTPDAVMPSELQSYGFFDTEAITEHDVARAIINRVASYDPQHYEEFKHELKEHVLHEERSIINAIEGQSGETYCHSLSEVLTNGGPCIIHQASEVIYLLALENLYLKLSQSIWSHFDYICEMLPRIYECQGNQSKHIVMAVFREFRKHCMDLLRGFVLFSEKDLSEHSLSAVLINRLRGYLSEQKPSNSYLHEDFCRYLGDFLCATQNDHHIIGMADTIERLCIRAKDILESFIQDKDRAPYRMTQVPTTTNLPFCISDIPGALDSIPRKYLLNSFCKRD